MKCTDLLMEDHKAILRGLGLLDEIALRVDHGERVPTEDIEGVLEFLRVFGDEYHQTKEESALFPELLRTTGSQRDPLRQMLFEHDQERSLVRGLDDALKTKRGIDFVLYANRLSALIRSHIYKEDHILFDVVERSLSDPQDDVVVAEFYRFDEDLGAATRQRLFDELHRLEWKYLRRVA